MGERTRSRAAHVQLAKSMAVSLVAFAVDFGLLALLTEAAGVHYLVSAGVSFAAGTTVSYALSVLWVFPDRRFSSRGLEYGLFLAVGLVGLGLNEALLWVFTEPLAIFYLASKVIAAAIIFFWNFWARKLLLFPRRGQTAHFR
jgi:putative flippase GtrA